MSKVPLSTKYQPSAWNPQLSPQEVIQKYLRIGEECQTINTLKFACRLKVPYGSRPGMFYDVYETPTLPKNAPAFVFIHGGYWQESSPSGNTFMVEPLVEAGIRVFLVGYDLCPTVTLRQIHAEIEEALSAILCSLSADAESCQRVVISGHSAGACLAISVCSEQRWKRLPHAHSIRSVVALGGIYDLSEAQHTDVVNRGNILGISAAEEDVKELSPMHNDYSHLGRDGFDSVSSPGVRVVVVTAEFDAPGLVQQGSAFRSKLETEGVDAVLVENEAFDHFDLVTELRHESCPLTRMIIDECKGCKG